MHVWLPKGGSVGHVSVETSKNYISLWPKTGAGKPGIKWRSYEGELIRNMRRDMYANGDVQTVNNEERFVPRKPDYTSTLSSLDGHAINQCFESLKSSEYFSEFFEIKFEEVAIINITGAKILENQTKVKIFQAFEKKNIQVKALSQSTDEINFSIVIHKKDLLDAVTILHEDLCEEFDSLKCEDNKN